MYSSGEMEYGKCSNDRCCIMNRQVTHASTADIITGLQLDKAEVLRGLREYLNIDGPEQYSADHLEERGVEKKSGQHFTLWGWEWSVSSQIVFRTTCGDCWETGKSAYGLFWAHCHLGQKLETGACLKSVLVVAVHCIWFFVFNLYYLCYIERMQNVIKTVPDVSLTLCVFSCL